MAVGESIYGENLATMKDIQAEVLDSLETLRKEITESIGLNPIEHCLTRIKAEDSMREKCVRKGFPVSCRSALVEIEDAIGFRVVCAFLSDVTLVREHLANLDGFEVVLEKDYITNAKPNGYRSYHMILRTTDGRVPVDCEPIAEGQKRAEGFYVEFQLRTISMDTWAALDHHLKYKKEAPSNERLIEAEMKRCADELASTDLSMQAIRDLIMDERS